MKVRSLPVFKVLLPISQFRDDLHANKMVAIKVIKAALRHRLLHDCRLRKFARAQSAHTIKKENIAWLGYYSSSEVFAK